jgi:hypothetical protein
MVIVFLRVFSEDIYSEVKVCVVGIAQFGECC